MKNVLRITETLFNRPLYIQSEKHEFQPARKINTLPRETFPGVFHIFSSFFGRGFRGKVAFAHPRYRPKRRYGFGAEKIGKTSSEGWKSEIFAKLLNASV